MCGQRRRVEQRDPAERPLHALFSEGGIRSREDRLAFACAAIGRDVTSSNDLTPSEVGLVSAMLQAGNAEDKPHTP